MLRLSEMLHVLCDDTKSIKPILNEAFVAFSEDIITDYNYLYCLDITMSAFVIVETTKQQRLLYTAQNSHLTSQYSKFFK